MIVHETKSVNLPIGLATSLGERGQKAFVVGVIAEDGFTTVASIHNVVDRAGVFDALCSRHGAVLPLNGICVNTAD